MEKKKKEIVRMLLDQDLGEKDEEEILDLLVNKPITVDVDKESDKNMTFGDKAADKISEVAGSWTFILGFCFFLLLWILVNGVLLVNNAVDPYPFILLNLVLSCLASLQAPIIMMSQNRQAKKDSKQLAKDYVEGKINFEQLQDKIYNQDTLRRVQLNEEKQASVLEKAEEAKVRLTLSIILDKLQYF